MTAAPGPLPTPGSSAWVEPPEPNPHNESRLRRWARALTSPTAGLVLFLGGLVALLGSIAGLLATLFGRRT